MRHFLDFIAENSNNQINGFVILKPGFMKYEQPFYDMLNNNGWQIIQKVKKQLSDSCTKELYKMHEKKDFYKELCNYMASDKCVCCACYKDCKDPIEDMKKIKDKVRDSWGKNEMENAMHSSDSLDNVNRESNLIFTNLQ